jgi:putative NADPH-quinone reductase
VKRIAIIQGHPDPAAARFCRAFQGAYMRGAEASGHVCKVIDVSLLDFSWLRSKTEYEDGHPAADIREAQDTLRWAEHLVVIFPLWLGDLPSLLKAFLEQALRPGFAYATGKGMPKKLLTGKSARVVVTMGMPAYFYRFYFGAHGLKNLRRNILGFCGVGPIRDTLIGMIESQTPAACENWLIQAESLGRDAR